MTEEESAPSTSPISTDHKRKLEDLESETPNPEVSSPSPVETSLTDSTVNGNANADDLENPSEKVQEISDGQTDEPEAKKPRLDEESHDSEPDQQVQKIEAPPEGDLQPPSKETVEEAVEAPQMEALGNIQPDGTAQHPSAESSAELDQQELKVLATPDEDLQPPPEENIQEATDAVDPSTGDVQPDGTAQFLSVVTDTQSDTGVPPPDNAQPLDPSEPDSERMTRRMEVPNNKVGVLIGKAGDTIRFLQYNSGAKIQITRDAESDPYSTSRQVELIGSLENVNKAEQLIKDVIAEADAGGSPSLVARGFGTPQSGAEQIQIQVLNEKVGMIIGKGGETIKNLQTKSGAHIQLVPQHLAEGDQPKERTVRVTGTKKQIESARDMIKEVMSQTLARPSPLSGGYSQQNFRPRGHAGPSQWGPTRGPPAQSQPMSYNYPQRGMYPSQTQQYPTQTYNGYPQQQSAPRSSYNMGWEQRPPTHMQGQPPQSGGYGYYGQGGPPASGNPALVSSPAPGPAPSQQNYNYGHPQGSEYGQPPPGFSHSVPQQSYENQVPSQHSYGSQQGYPQQTHAPSGYGQPPYVRPGYGMQPSQGPPQSYGPPRAAQPGDMPQYQTSINPSYGSSGQPQQQSYPYGSSGPSYGPTPTANDVYAQQASFSAPGYAQQGGAAPYVQQGVPSQPGYAQGGQAGAYGQYPSSQPGYGEQPHPTQSNPSYGGYQGSADGGYGNGQGSAYGIPQGGGQAGYVQPNSNPPSYDQSMPQSVYGSHAATAPAGYTKSLSPQPAYAQQYESGQMYGQAHH